MLKKDLKPGTVVAATVRHNPGLSPALLLSDILLHQDTSGSGSTGKISKARQGARPCEEWNFRQGYAIVYFAPATIAESNKLSRAEMGDILAELDGQKIADHIVNQKRLGLPEDIQQAYPRLHVTLINNAKITGFWQVEGPAQDEREAITDASNAAARLWETERNVALGRARSSLAALLGAPTLRGSNAAFTAGAPRSGQEAVQRSQGSIELSLEQAMKLISMIPMDLS